MCEGKKIHMMERTPASPTVIYVNVDTPSKVETTPVIKGNMAVRSDPDLSLPLPSATNVPEPMLPAAPLRQKLRCGLHNAEHVKQCHSQQSHTDHVCLLWQNHGCQGQSRRINETEQKSNHTREKRISSVRIHKPNKQLHDQTKRYNPEPSCQDKGKEWSNKS